MASLVLQNGSYTQTLSFTGGANETVDLTGLGVNSKSANGYLKLPNGLIIQWGNAGSVGATSTVSVTFPISFPNSCLNASATSISTSGYGMALNAAPTTTGLVLSNRNSAAQTGSWIAIGY